MTQKLSGRDFPTACEVLGLPLDVDEATLNRTAIRYTLEHHPDPMSLDWGIHPTTGQPWTLDELRVAAGLAT